MLSHDFTHDVSTSLTLPYKLALTTFWPCRNRYFIQDAIYQGYSSLIR